MSTALVALIAGLLGAVVGFYFRAAEFRRDQRLKVYGDFIAAFISIGHEGAGGASLHMSYGDSLWGEHREKLAAVWPIIAAALVNFEQATARLRLVASKDARIAAEELENFINQNVRSVPPLRQSKPDEWGDAAKVGPSKIDSETVRLARAFADRVSRDVTPRWDRSKRDSRSAAVPPPRG